MDCAAALWPLYAFALFSGAGIGVVAVCLWQMAANLRRRRRRWPTNGS